MRVDHGGKLFNGGGEFFQMYASIAGPRGVSMAGAVAFAKESIHEAVDCLFPAFDRWFLVSDGWIRHILPGELMCMGFRTSELLIK
jgi:hypothetical protein